MIYHDVVAKAQLKASSVQRLLAQVGVRLLLSLASNIGICYASKAKPTQQAYFQKHNNMQV